MGKKSALKSARRDLAGLGVRPWTPLVQGTTRPGYDATFINSLYEVAVVQMAEGVTQLSICRRDRDWIRDWRHLQRIKNELCGPEREGIEIFPRESRLVDTSNQYFLWVLPLGVSVGFGFQERLLSEQSAAPIGRQRPWEDGEKPLDLTTWLFTIDKLPEVQNHRREA